MKMKRPEPKAGRFTVALTLLKWPNQSEAPVAVPEHGYIHMATHISYDF
jgi:hypothetical protein